MKFLEDLEEKFKNSDDECKAMIKALKIAFEDMEFLAKQTVTVTEGRCRLNFNGDPNGPGVTFFEGEEWLIGDKIRGLMKTMRSVLERPKSEFVLEKPHGLPMNKCMPNVVTARVVRIETTNRVVESLEHRPDETVQKSTIYFRWGDEGGYLGKQVFSIGDVTPVLGQYVRGVAICNQWGSYYFFMTHLLKKEQS